MDTHYIAECCRNGDHFSTGPFVSRREAREDMKATGRVRCPLCGCGLKTTRVSLPSAPGATEE